MVLGDNAYDVVPGFLGAPVGTFEEHIAGPARVEARRSIPDVQDIDRSASGERRRSAGEVLPREFLNASCAELAFYATVAAYAAAARALLRSSGRPGLRSSRGKAGPVRPRARCGIARRLHLPGEPGGQRLPGRIDPLLRVGRGPDGHRASTSSCAKRAGIEALGAFVAPVALTFVLGSRFVGGAEQAVGGGLLAVHVTVNVLGDALFLLASARGGALPGRGEASQAEAGASMFGRAASARCARSRGALACSHRLPVAHVGHHDRHGMGAAYRDGLARRDRARAFRLRNLVSFRGRARSCAPRSAGVVDAPLTAPSRASFSRWRCSWCTW